MAAGRVGVVGAGLAGLSAGLDLKRRGFAVDLFERSRLLGGKVTSFTVAETEVDNGQHVYLGCCTDFIDFVRRLEPSFPGGSPLALQRRFDALLLARNRRPARLREAPLPAPLQMAPALLRYGHVSRRGRLAIALALLGARRPARRGETFAAWLDRHHQPDDARRAFWDPFLVPALNAPPEEVSADAALFVITTAFLGSARAARFGYARVPLGRIAAAAAERLDDVCLRTPVARVEVGEGAASGGVQLVLEDGGRRGYDGVVLAVPPARLSRLLDPPEAFGVAGLDAFRAAPIVDVHLWYDLPDVGFDFAAILDSPVQWVFAKGRGYLCCSMSAATEAIGLSNAELVELCHRELAAVLPALWDRPPLRGAATRDREATFISSPGLRRPGPATASPLVAIAGAWTDTGWPATMESAVRSGRAAAQLLAGNLRPPRVN
ncbi:MAG: FAD-dependent oxidoreductase [Chloroflexi bacterium]|nr:FAD-dependent oxidoreductase [Chloroflexota bacterium]